MDITINDDQQVNVVIHPVDALGKPAPVQGVPVWTLLPTTPPATCTVVPAADGLSADLISGVIPEEAQVQIVANLPDGTSITELILLHITAADAVNLGAVAGAPTLKTP